VVVEPFATDEHGITRKRQKQRHGNKTKNKQKHLPRTNTELHGKDRSRDTEIRPRISRSICHGFTRIYTEGRHSEAEVSHGRLNKRGQVSFSALTIFYSWFGLTAEKET
jgi:hypothetical protein